MQLVNAVLIPVIKNYFCSVDNKCNAFLDL